MADFHEQVKLISTLRARCRTCDDALYRARVDLHRTDLILGRAKQRQTVVDTDRDRRIGELRARMERLNASLSQLRDEDRQLTGWFARLAEQQRLLEHLQRNLEVCRNRIRDVRRRLAELRQSDPAPAGEIAALETELARLERAQSDISASIEQTADTLHGLEEDEQEKRQRQEDLKTSSDELRDQLGDTQGQLTELFQPAFNDTESVENRRKEAIATIDRLQTDCGDCDGTLHAAIGDLYVDPHPRDGLAHLDDRTPFLLLPVRLETIFVPIAGVEGQGRTQLWVRIYPDEISIHTHEKTLTDREVVAGELYWTELVSAEYLRTEKDSRRRSAWRHLVELFGGQRAAWVARQTRPSDFDVLAAGGGAQNLIDLLLSIDAAFFDNLLALDLSNAARQTLQQAIDNSDADAFSRLAEDEGWFHRVNEAVRQRITGFPAHDLTKNDTWTRAPRTHVLPDRFVLLLYSSTTAPPREVVGNVIPDTMFLGPDPLDTDAAFPNKDGAVVYGESFDWLADFDKAVALGVGFRIDLSAEDARNGFAKIVALGVFLSADANESAALLEELIDNHQFGPKGFSLVRQGTPTNNTERDGTGYSDNDPYDDLAFFTATDPPAFDPVSSDPKKSRTDGRLLADALGIGYRTLQTVQRADQIDVLEATAMNTALFPGTLGYWLRNWTAPAVSAETAQRTRAFFTAFVTGRGPLPSIRIGNQPYGVLLTSDFSRWTYPEQSPIAVRLGGDQLAFLKNLQSLLTGLEKVWTRLVGELPFVGKPGTDSADVLMNILGLHPTSVEFYQRIGYSDEYLRNLISFKDGGRYQGELVRLVLTMALLVRPYLNELGVDRDLTTINAMKCFHVLWQHYHTLLNASNLVENKPPSEINTLTVNYISLIANTDDTLKIVNQNFGVTPLPSALLYLMLRNAILLQLHHGSYEWLKERTTFDLALERSLQTTSLLGMREAVPSVSKVEVMGTPIGAAEPSHPTPSVSVADFIWLGPDPAEVEGAFLKDQKAALQLLVDTPTARLERTFVEHLDCCNYRLDAWQTGLFAQRLQAQRQSGGSPDARRQGIYLGAYGWVESVRPTPKVFLNRDTIPASLRPVDSNPILEEDEVVGGSSVRQRGAKRGGFVHAPSINHAGAAALLRNAYLSHANPDEAQLFAVNLSSERVRGGEFILEGMRNGQPIEALLGYQFERRLHDRTSESAARGDVPVLEFNQFILPYRQAFPFESREVAQAGTGAPTETIPPYSVVNGLRLIEATLDSGNGFGLASILSPAERPNATLGAAIVAERDALKNSLDAVKDLLMAENAFQLVRGNFDRVAAVSLAQKDAQIPQALEVIETPRGTEFTFTNRVTLHFADLDPSLPASNPWPALAMTPRASAEPGINQWLGSILGAAPERTFCEVSWIETAEDGTVTAHDTHPVSLADLAIQPIDFVWITSASQEDTGGATELETRIAFRYRRAHGVADDKTVRITFKPVVAAGARTFAEVFLLARHLRTLLLESRALHAQDFLPASGGKDTTTPVDKNNPKGYDLAELRTRVESAANALGALADDIDGAGAPTVQLDIINDPANPADNEAFSGPLGSAFTKLEELKLQFTDAKQLTVTFSLADAEVLHRTLQSVANFGIADAFPSESDLSIDSAKASLLARAHRTARRLRRNDPKDGVLDRVTTALSQATPEKTVEARVLLVFEAGRILFGETFNLLPKFTCFNDIDIATADADRNQLLQHAIDATPGMTADALVDEWLQGLARVRKALYRWELVRTLADALGDVTLGVRPAQIPYRANDSWLAVEFPATDPDDATKPFAISRDTLSIAAHGSTAFQAGVKQSGVMIDDWTEEIPTDTETTGIAFRYNQPNAVPPQALLLAVTPAETGSWSWDNLVGILDDTLQRAKRRAVEPDQLEKQSPVWNALAPATVSEFSTIQQADVSLDLMGVLEFAALTEFYTRRV
jgi:predicted  nucleic acid-binding Zn-ribbon protein